MAARPNGELGPAQPGAKCIISFESERGRWFTELDKYASMTDDDALAEVAAHAAASAAASPRAKMSPRAAHAARQLAAGQLESVAQFQMGGEGAFVEVRAELLEDPQNSQLGVSWLVLKDVDNGRPFLAASVLGCRVSKPRSTRVGHERALRLDIGNGASAKKVVIEFDMALEDRWTSELKKLGGMSRVRSLYTPSINIADIDASLADVTQAFWRCFLIGQTSMLMSQAMNDGAVNNRGEL